MSAKKAAKNPSRKKPTATVATVKTEPFPGHAVARSIGRAPELWAWECLPRTVFDRGARNSLAMVDSSPPWPCHYHGRLAHAAAMVAGIARRNGGWERLESSLQSISGADDCAWRQIRAEQLTAFIAGALAALGIGVQELAAAKLLENVVKEVPRLAWRDPIEVGDPRVAWLRRKLVMEPTGAVTSRDLQDRWAAYAARTGLPALTAQAESTRMGRAIRAAFSTEMEKQLVLKSENLTHSQAGEIFRCRGWVGLIFADWDYGHQ